MSPAGRIGGKSPNPQYFRNQRNQRNQQRTNYHSIIINPPYKSMATPYMNESAQWQEHNRDFGGSNFRSVTPAMNNRATTPGGGSHVADHYSSRYSTDTPTSQARKEPPASTGLIRLSLRKPMGIVFEPMYDPNNPSVQRGVRICDLPRTGAAALSRKLEVGDELLSINDKTMSRLSFDEIMDFIIEADPEEVNLLFRRPRKEVLSARLAVKPVASTNNAGGVKWVDDDGRKKKESSKKSSGKESSSSKKKSSSRKSRSQRDDDETLQSDEVEYSNSRRKKGRRGRRDPYESESFLDILIDTICANPDNVCRDRRRGDDDDSYYDEDDGTFASIDDSTYLTYESEEPSLVKSKQQKKKSSSRRTIEEESYGETEEDTVEDRHSKKKSQRGSSPKPKRAVTPPKKKTYDDDHTLETVDSAERAKQLGGSPEKPVVPPLGLAPNPNPEPAGPGEITDTDDTANPAPIRELQYDDNADVGADVSVMESLGGPSLLIEKQRMAAANANRPEPPAKVPQEIIDNFGHDYPLDFGFTREQSIQNDPLRFYTHVVKALLQEHEPEKVRLLDKLLAKYKGREDHLIQKLSVRYMKEADENGEGQDDNDGQHSQHLADAVQQNKNSENAVAAIEIAKERMSQDEFDGEMHPWPDKETKEQEEEDLQDPPVEEGDGSDYSGDSIDGTSPAVIAQVSELLNYVYGKTSVPGQIDRVSTIMRAYEGREAVLLELLETKALIKANREKENAGQLPSFLRNSNMHGRNLDTEIEAHGDVPPVTPMAQPGSSPALHDDISSMSGVSTPADVLQSTGVLGQITTQGSSPDSQGMNVEIPLDEDQLHGGSSPTSSPQKPPTPERSETKKKKKGIFGGLFKKGKKNKDASVASGDRATSRSRAGGLISPMSRKKGEGSI